MPEQTGDDAAQGAAEEQAQGATAGPDKQAQGAASGGDDSVDALRERIELLQRENFTYRDEKRKREEADKKRTEGEQSEVEKLTAKVSEMESALADRERRAKEQSLRLASVTEAQRLGFRNPDIAHRLIDQGKVEYDDSGDATNIGSLMEAIAKSDPYLIAATDFGGGVRGQSASKPNDDMNARIRRSVGR